MTSTTRSLTPAQAKAITTFVEGDTFGGGSVEYPRLESALGVKTQKQAQALAAEAMRMTGKTDSDIAELLALPHGASVTELIQQDLTGALLAFGFADGGVVDEGGGEGEPSPASGDGGEKSPAETESSGSGGKNAAKVAGAGAAAAGVAAGASALSGLGFFTSAGFWKGVGLCVAGGLILIFAALEFLRMSGASVPSVRIG